MSVNRKKRSRLSQVLEEERAFSSASAAELRDEFEAWKKKIRLKETSLPDIHTSALALVREAAFRATGLKAYPCQVEAALALTEPAVSEIATGEGKTLITAIAACVYALDGRGVHVATVNSYLAERDYEFASEIASMLGLTVGFLEKDQAMPDKQAAYLCDITYGTGYDFGFDYLRDQLVLQERARVAATRRLRQAFLKRASGQLPVAQRQGHAYAIVDEIDSVLIDEASSPLVIAQSRAEGSTLRAPYELAHRVAGELEDEEHFRLDYKGQNPVLTQVGKNHINHLPDIPWDTLIRPWHQYVSNALNAIHSFRRDEHYIVQDDKVVIVDEFTGRAHEERSWQAGLHQAVAEKEGIEIPPETETAASITRQRYFRIYDTLCGLTGTAEESIQEFRHFFGLPVRAIAPNKLNRRESLPDRVFQSRDEMLHAVAAEVKERRKTGQPILIGTRTVGISEALAKILFDQKTPHRVLNASQDKEEAEIVAEAGKFASVTVATNMAGRGTHISLSDKVLELGGLHVIGVERSESIRVDRQLIGRAARQGQPGSAQFFLSADDKIIEEFAPKLAKRMQKMDADENGELPRSISDEVKTLQTKVEKIRYHQRMDLEKRDEWLDQTRRNLA
ncbi:MAG: hypothetical protein MI807_23770 [Verrucomicrobiales bacterium]|nr:hypothetical protein [Verrucomicrobiales bacterium]